MVVVVVLVELVDVVVVDVVAVVVVVGRLAEAVPPPTTRDATTTAAVTASTVADRDRRRKIFAITQVGTTCHSRPPVPLRQGTCHELTPSSPVATAVRWRARPRGHRGDEAAAGLGRSAQSDYHDHASGQEHHHRARRAPTKESLVPCATDLEEHFGPIP